MHILDLVIIGAGPIGLACGVEAEKEGLDYLILEKGCLVNSLYHYPTNMTFFSTSDKLEIGNIPFVSISNKPTRAEALEYYRRVAIHFKLKLRLFEAIENVKKEDTHFELQTSKGQTIRAKKLIVATGFYDIPVSLGVPGENLKKVNHYYNDPNYFTFRKVLVVGAGNSAVDVALETYRKSAEVTMVIKGSDIDPNVKYWVRPDIVNRIAEGSIKAFINSEVKEIRENEVDINTPDGVVTIQNDEVLAMTGYRPNYLFLKKLGIECSIDAKQMPLHDQDSMETNIPGLYLAGVVCGGMDTHTYFIENSREHAIKIIKHIQAHN